MKDAEAVFDIGNNAAAKAMESIVLATDILSGPGKMMAIALALGQLEAKSIALRKVLGAEFLQEAIDAGSAEMFDSFPNILAKAEQS